MENIFHGDCLDFLKGINDNTIDCVITDPPYFLDTMCDNWCPKVQENRKSNSHIVKLPNGMKFKSDQGKNLKLFIEKVSKELYRVLKPGGFFLCFSSPRLYHNVVSGIESVGFEIRDSISWTYKTSQVKAFRQDHIIDNDKVMTLEQKTSLKELLKNHRTPQLKSNFEPICLAMKPIEGRFIDNYQKWKTGLMKVPENSPFPCNVMFCPKPSKKERENNHHPTVKPIKLIKDLIEMFCPENGIVLDPFLGSGTTVVASKEAKRMCKGSEKNEEYIKIIENRLK